MTRDRPFFLVRRGRTLARSHGHFDIRLVGIEAGVLVYKPEKVFMGEAWRARA